MKVLTSLQELQSFLKNSGESIAFIPTMGNLHSGHISLIQTAKKFSKNIICSIFVNPAQFSENEDFATYPKTPEQDLEKLENAGVNAVYIPSLHNVYPVKPKIQLDIPHLTHCLCGVSRPNFFNGVMTVVLKLILQIKPKFIIFGDKDYQQLLVIKEMVASLSLPVKVISSPIIRNENGLALSSRNGYFSSLEIPEKINKILFECVETSFRTGVELALLEAKNHLNFLDKIDYLEVRSSENLLLYKVGDDLVQFRLFFAGNINGIRLIDNISFGL